MAAIPRPTALARILAVAAALLFFCSSLLPAVPATAADMDGPYGEAIRKARLALWHDINTGRAASATVAIMDGGEVVYAEGFGMADRERGIPATPETRFNIGSVSKVFAATAIMLLVDEGLVDLDAPATRYLPGFTMADPRYEDITVRMLLSHTSGLNGTLYTGSFGYAYNPHVHEELLEALSLAHLRHAPGAMAVYTNDGFTLAEMVVERVSGQKYIDFLAERVFTPLSLRHTGPSVGQEPGKPSAAYYQPATGKREPFEVVSLLGTGGLGSTAVDLVRFADTFSGAGVQILSPAALAEMRKAQPNPLDGRLRNPHLPYGLGWDMVEVVPYRDQGIQVLGKSGGTFQFTSMLYTVPDHRVSVAVIEAGQGANAGVIALDILDAVLVGKGLVEPDGGAVARPVPAEPVPAEYGAYAGYYVGDGGALFRVSFDGGSGGATVAAVQDDGTEVPVSRLVYHQGYFYEDGNPKRPTYFTTVDGAMLYITQLAGHDMVRLQRLPEIAGPGQLAVDLDGSLWLRRNVKPYESTLFAGEHLVRPLLLPELPGYVGFQGVKAIASPTFAAMPVEAVRDQTELRLVDMGGTPWILVYDMLFSPADQVPLLPPGGVAATIGAHGYNEWFKVPHGAVVGFRLPEGGRAIVFSPEGAPVYDSAVDTGPVFVAGNGLIELAGRPGDTFHIMVE